MANTRKYVVVSGAYGRTEDRGVVKSYKKGDVVEMTPDVARRLGAQVKLYNEAAEAAEAAERTGAAAVSEAPIVETGTAQTGETSFVLPSPDELYALPVSHAAHLLMTAPDQTSLQALADLEVKNPKNPGGRNGVKKAFEKRAAELAGASQE